MGADAAEGVVCRAPSATVCAKPAAPRRISTDSPARPACVRCILLIVKMFFQNVYFDGDFDIRDRLK